MSDFLHSLRSNKDKRFDRNRRNFDSPNYRSNDRQNNADRKRKGPYRSQQNEQAQAYAAITKLLPTIKTLLEAQNEDRKRLIEAEERKAQAMEAIASFLRQFAGTAEKLPALESIESLCEGDTCAPVEDTLPAVDTGEDTPAVEAAPGSDSQPPSLQPQAGAESNRDELIETITRLRADGYSYEKIARHLEANAIPTISGRGKWRGQAVSKLCQ